MRRCELGGALFKEGDIDNAASVYQEPVAVWPRPLGNDGGDHGIPAVALALEDICCTQKRRVRRQSSRSRADPGREMIRAI